MGFERIAERDSGAVIAVQNYCRVIPHPRLLQRAEHSVECYHEAMGLREVLFIGSFSIFDSADRVRIVVLESPVAPIGDVEPDAAILKENVWRMRKKQVDEVDSALWCSGYI